MECSHIVQYQTAMKQKSRPDYVIKQVMWRFIHQPPGLKNDFWATYTQTNFLAIFS